MKHIASCVWIDQRPLPVVPAMSIVLLENTGTVDFKTMKGVNISLRQMTLFG